MSIIPLKSAQIVRRSVCETERHQRYKELGVKGTETLPESSILIKEKGREEKRGKERRGEDRREERGGRIELI